MTEWPMPPPPGPRPQPPRRRDLRPRPEVRARPEPGDLAEPEPADLAEPERSRRAEPGPSSRGPEPAGVAGEEASARILQWPGPRVPAGTDAEEVPAGSAGRRRRRGRPVLVPAAVLLAAWAATCVLDVVRPEPLDRLVVAAAAVSPFAVVVAIPVVALAARGRLWITAALAAVASLMPWMFALGYAAPAAALPVNGVRLSVMLLDADGAGADAPSVVAAVARQRVDVLVVTETSRLLTHRLTTSGLDPRLEARWVSPLGGSAGGGLCVYSRYPVSAVEQVDGTRWPAVRLTLDVGRGTVSLVAGRASPWEQGTTAWRRDLAALGAAVRLPGPAVLAGTLDANAQQPAFRRLTGSGLRDGAAVLGRGIRPTWPSWSPLPLLPLDHVLVGTGIGVRSIGTLAVAGTSHRALVAALVVPPAPRMAPVGG